MSQGEYDQWNSYYNDCAEGWNLALQSIALLAAKDEDYATANRCLSEFKPVRKMVSRNPTKTSSYGDRLYNFKSKLVTAPEKDLTIKKVQSIKMIKDIEREFNAANFARGSSQLSETAKSVLNKLVKLLAKDEALSVKFIGHTSSDGDDAFNQQLSKDRAKAAASYLESKGIKNYMVEIGGEIRARGTNP
jgi:outer membrane protein OmpA-like peptidoglycan-associated protein